jgi:hypothetical protein
LAAAALRLPPIAFLQENPSVDLRNSALPDFKTNFHLLRETVF